MAQAPDNAATIDPVCGMTVDPATAKHRVRHESTEYCFCSAGCADKFSGDPASYLGGPGETVADSPNRQEPGEGAYFCPMCPGVHSNAPDICPKCGMALESAAVLPGTKTHYTCPMHPEIIRDGPGACPICGMALEPVTVTVDVPPNPELIDMTRRFWIGAVLTTPLLVITMGEMVPGIAALVGGSWNPWAQLALAAPVVLWAGWPFFVRGWKSVVTRNLNMFTLIAIGTATAFLYSLIAVLAPEIFPAGFRGASGQVGLYFEAAAVIVTLVLLGQVLELRARERTGGALRALLDLAPKTAYRLSLIHI